MNQAEEQALSNTSVELTLECVDNVTDNIIQGQFSHTPLQDATKEGEVEHHFDRDSSESKACKPPQVGLDLEVTQVGLGLEATQVGLGLEAPEVGLGLEAPEVGLEATQVGLGLEAPEVGSGLEATLVGPGLEATLVGPGLEATLVGPGLEATQVGPGLEATQGPGLEATQVGPGLEATQVGPGLEATQNSVQKRSREVEDEKPDLFEQILLSLGLVEKSKQLNSSGKGEGNADPRKGSTQLNVESGAAGTSNEAGSSVWSSFVERHPQLLVEETEGRPAKKLRTRKRKSQKKPSAPGEDDLATDPSEPVYCMCERVAFGRMIMCDNNLCPSQWFHFPCVGVTRKPRGRWFCPKCRNEQSEAKGTLDYGVGKIQ